MVKWHLRSKKKPTGGILNKNRKKKRSQRGSVFLQTKVGKNIAKKKDVRGNNKKIKLLSAETISVADPKTGKTKKTKMITAKENPANPHYVRRNILTKGAIVETELGLVKITSRICQTGIVSGVLVEKKQ